MIERRALLRTLGLGLLGASSRAAARPAGADVPDRVPGRRLGARIPTLVEAFVLLAFEITDACPARIWRSRVSLGRTAGTSSCPRSRRTW